MSASDTAAHLNYLTDAAHLLAFTAPETSSYLMTRRNGLMLAGDLEQSATQRQHVCGACGCIMILGQNSTLKLENDRAVHRKSKQKGSIVTKVQAAPRIQRDVATGPSKVFTCANCGRYTKVQLPAPELIARKKQLAVVSKQEETPKPAPSANASSKKRAKNRKAGLQALLSQTGSGGAKSGLGLSLSDFMKR